MELHVLTTLEGGGFIGMSDGNDNPVGCIFWSKEQGRIILGAIKDPEDIHGLYLHLRGAMLPERSDKKIVTIFGPAVIVFDKLFTEAYKLLNDGRTLDIEQFPTSRFYIHQTFPAKSGAINFTGWRDENGEYRLAVLYSREQVRMLFRGIDWIPPGEHKKIAQALQSGDLPRKSRQRRIIIAGKLIGCLAGAQLVHQQLKAQENQDRTEFRRSLSDNPLRMYRNREKLKNP